MVSQRETIKGEALACMREAHAIAKRLIVSLWETMVNNQALRP